MPFLPSGSISFVRFKVDGSKPRQFNEDTLEQLVLRRMNGPGMLGLGFGSAAFGWSAGAHELDHGEACFATEKCVWPDHLAVDLSVKTNPLPAGRLKAYYETDLRALSKDNPSGFPSTKQRKEARESARERLEQEASDGRYIKYKCHPILWDQLSNEVFCSATSATAQDMLCQLFNETFDKELMPITPASIALDLYPDAKDEQMSPFLADMKLERPSWAPIDTQPDFLGNEFLMWLWFTAQTDTDTLDVIDPTGEKAGITFMFSGGVRVEDPRAIAGNDVMNSDSAITLPEAKVAIAHGKLPRQAALTLVYHDDQYSFKLRASDFAVTSCKLPKPPDDMNDQRAKLEHRLQATHELAVALDLIYKKFLTARFGPMWAMDLSNIQGWLQSSARGKGARKK